MEPLLPVVQPPRQRYGAAAGGVAALIVTVSATLFLAARQRVQEVGLGRGTLAVTMTLSSDIDPICGAAMSPGELPFVEILGQPPLPPFLEFPGRPCTPLYEGPDCANITDFDNVVTVCVNGSAIHGVSMRSRGHISKFFPKQQFHLTLPHAMSLLGLAPATEFSLAMSYIDTSFQRNPTAFELYHSLGGWAPQTRFVTMAWEGVDFGLYYIGELIQPQPGRLELPETRLDSGYLLAADWPTAGQYAIVTANTSSSFNVMYPVTLSEAQKTFVQTFMDELDQRVAGNSQGDIEELIDFESAARFYVLMELVKDVDGYAFSDYWMIKDGRLQHAAPWDFDLAMGYECAAVFSRSALTGELFSTLEGWNVEIARDSMPWLGPDGKPNGAIKYFGMNKRQLFLNLWRQPSFRVAFAAAWRAARQGSDGPISDASLQSTIMTRSESIAPAAEHDIFLWRNSHREGFFTPCHMDAIANFTLSRDYLVEYLIGRAHWIDHHVESLLVQ